MKEEYIQFLKNLIKFTKVFKGPFKVKDLEKEIKQMEEFQYE